MKLSPTEAWKRYMAQVVSEPGWIEKRSQTSNDMPLLRRELFGLILLAHLRNHQHNNVNWYVGYDPSQSEPNDGFVSDGTITNRVEHKLTPQQDVLDALDAILDRYRGASDPKARGRNYGEDRTLLIQADKASSGMIPISDLCAAIGDECSFDEVLLMICVAIDGNQRVLQIYQVHPPSLKNAEIVFDLSTGGANVRFSQFDPGTGRE